MTWSYRLGRLAGIDIRVHLTFVLLLVVLGLGQLGHGLGPGVALGSLFFMASVFGIVVLHELGHALAARRYGIETHDITLLPIGGIARLEREPRTPGEEIVISLAGPAVNVALAVFFGLLAVAVSGPYAIGGSSAFAGSLFGRLFWVNVGLAVFNLLPAFPMDGGRVFRAALEIWRGRFEATRIAARVGQGIALLLGLYGLVSGQLMLALVAVFVWMGATEELGRLPLGGGWVPPTTGYVEIVIDDDRRYGWARRPDVLRRPFGDFRRRPRRFFRL